MLRRVIIADVAEEEIRDFKKSYKARSNEKASEFLSEIRVAIRSIHEFPFARAVQTTIGGMEIRRAKIARFPYVLFYFVYPSFDSNTVQALDVIYILACRHERQGEPLWAERDPFGSP